MGTGRGATSGAAKSSSLGKWLACRRATSGPLSPAKPGCARKAQCAVTGPSPGSKHKAAELCHSWQRELSELLGLPPGLPPAPGDSDEWGMNLLPNLPMPCQSFSSSSLGGREASAAITACRMGRDLNLVPARTVQMGQVLTVNTNFLLALFCLFWQILATRCFVPRLRHADRSINGHGIKIPRQVRGATRLRWTARCWELWDGVQEGLSRLSRTISLQRPQQGAGSEVEGRDRDGPLRESSATTARGSS